MMILDTAFYRPSATEAFGKDVDRLLRDRGRAAFRLGWRLRECPPFTLRSMTAAWKAGWRAERDIARSRAHAR